MNGNYEEELFDEKTFDRLFKMIQEGDQRHNCSEIRDEQKC